MNVTKDLMNEHQLILGYVQLLKDYVTHTKRRSDDLLLEKGPQFIDFIRNFADRFHHAKEEEVLFKHMETDGVLTHCNPLPQMLHEHEEGRAAVQAMLKAVDTSDQEAFAGAALAYAALLEDHIYKEDNILYEMAEAGLSEQQKADIQKEYAVADGTLRSESIWTNYTQQLEDLRECLKTSKPVSNPSV